MKIPFIFHNWTNIPIDKIFEIINFVDMEIIEKYAIGIANTSEGVFRGVSRKNGKYHKIFIQIGNESQYPYKYIPYTPLSENGYLPWPEMENRTEGMVYVLSHELRHLWQNENTPKRIDETSVRYRFRNERDSCEYAESTLSLWRNK